MKKLFIMSVVSLIILMVIFAYYTARKPNNIKNDIKYTDENKNNSSDSDSDSDVIVLKFAHNFQIPHPQYMAITEKFVPMVTQGSNWKIRVEVYPNNSLGSEEQIVQGVKLGTIEMCLASEALAKTVPGIKLFEIPYLFQNYEEVTTALKGDLGNRISGELNSMGIKDLAWSLNGFRQIAISYKDTNKEMVKPRLATINSDMNKIALESMGYDVFPLDANQTTLILNQQLVEGHDNPPVVSYYNGWYDDVKNIFITKHSISPTAYIINAKFWEGLKEDQRELIKNAAQVAADYEIELLKNTEADIFDTLKKREVKIEYPKLSQSNNIDMRKFGEMMKSSPELEKMYIDFLNEKEKAGNTPK